ncbi:MAG: sensor histidine kinase [Metallibacterium scheffleri]|jgi:signal transduction histidine kinase|uniref:histidine kinase n=1 Tax=Metallibacterium scheffleri TaxID=993689 RepID=A0A4S3KS17_9GAMM|nr:HAMP domain-containing sensor histidine kinase [Metallibacterium scheffleri]MDE3141031.1 HAMP domain-containing histidine kinase [Pseudomonadota bacterium]THD11882.1 sensor histidine kinase [Metallibacterium scheffleri]
MLKSRRRLRSRIFISFVIFGLALTSLFAVATIYMRARLEDQLINNTLQKQVDRFVEFKRKNPSPDAPFFFPLVKMYIASRQHFPNVPFEWQPYVKTGVYDITERDAGGKLVPYKLAVFRSQNYWAFLRYDISSQREGEQQLLMALIVAVLLFGALSVVIGLWMSRRVMHPVTELAGRLRASRRAGTLQKLAPHFADDEVGELAGALDEYAERLTSMVRRDHEFNADVSHELRTPLAVIASTTELMLAAPEMSEKLRERLKRIERASRQAAEIIDALLLLSRAERQGPADGESTDVAKAVADVLELQRPQLRNKPVSVSLQVEAALVVNAPASVVSVALSNLVGNAFKYTQQGDVLVRVQEGRVLVEDSGPGIKPEDAEHLFERGVRGEGVKGGGAGLGLAIVRRLCDLYGWRVRLAPRPEGGAVAILEFDAALRPAVAAGA